MGRRGIAMLILLVLLAGCMEMEEPQVMGEPPVAESSLESSPPDEPREEEFTEAPPETPARREIVMARVTREQAGLHTLPAGSLGGHRPPEELLSLADGSLPYTDAHFAAGMRHGMEFPFMRGVQRDLVVLLPQYNEPVVAGIRTGDAMSDVEDILGSPTLSETSELDPNAAFGEDGGIEGDEPLLAADFLHYKGEGFYISFLGRDGVIEMIGVKRLPPVDYPDNLLEDWQDTLLTHGEKASVESLEAFFQSLNYVNWSGGISVSNKGVILWDGHYTSLSVYNDFQGELYAQVYADDGTFFLDPGPESAQLVHFYDEDSNVRALRIFLGEFYLLERKLNDRTNPSPGGTYAVVSETITPYGHYHCIRSVDLQRRDAVVRYVDGELVWLDERYFLLRSSITNRLVVQRADDLSWEGFDLAEAWSEEMGVLLSVSTQDRELICMPEDDPFVLYWDYNSAGEIFFYSEDGERAPV